MGLDKYDPSDDLDRMQRDIMERDELIAVLEAYLDIGQVVANFVKRIQQEQEARYVLLKKKEKELV